MAQSQLTFAGLSEEIRACDLCAEHLPLGARPVFQADPSARILIVGQAPGTAVHRSGVPFDDPSGERLRGWLGVDRKIFYNAKKMAIVPMAFCYPGRGKSGDLPPRPECAARWRAELLAHLNQIELTVAVGRYAIDWHVDQGRKRTVTEIVKDWRSHWPAVVPMPHPSPRNQLWFRKNPWLEADIVPALQKRVAQLIGTG
jgi:uracil-DNA glycosylase